MWYRGCSGTIYRRLDMGAKGALRHLISRLPSPGGTGDFGFGAGDYLQAHTTPFFRVPNFVVMGSSAQSGVTKKGTWHAGILLFFLVRSAPGCVNYGGIYSDRHCYSFSSKAL